VLATNVLSFAALFYDPTVVPPSNPWQTVWDSDSRLPGRATYPEIPVSIYLRIEVYAGGPRTIPELQPGERIPTVALSTVVNVEAVLADPRTSLLRPVAVPVIP
jgi:hypothetical protein